MLILSIDPKDGENFWDMGKNFPRKNFFDGWI